MRSSPAKCIAASHCLIRALTITATGCYGIPPTPTLIDVQLQLWADRGDLLDEAISYTALRSVKVEQDRVALNGRPYVFRFVLDQGYWPETGLTPPDDAALAEGR